MLRDEELPPLPTESFVGEDGLWEQRVALTEDSVREYARAVEQAAYEAAIKACDKIAGNHRQFSDERRRGAGMCSAEISALKEQK